MTAVGGSAVAGLRSRLPGLLALALASCLAVTTEVLPIGLLPAIGATFGTSEATTGLLVSLYAVMVAALSVPLTLLTTRLPRKPLLLATVFGYLASNLVVALAPTFAVLAAGRVIGGITHALFFSLCIGYVPRLVVRSQVGRALSIATGGASAGFVLGVPVSTSLGTAVGWRLSFGLLAVLAGVTLLLLIRLLPAVDSGADEHAGRQAGRRRDLGAVAAANTVTYLGQFTVYTYISVLLLGAGASPALVGPILLICGACGLIGLWLTGRGLDHAPRRSTAATLAVVVLAVAAFGLGYPALIAMVVAAAVWNGAFGGVPLIYQACAVRTHAVAPEMAGAWVNSTANIGIAGGSALGAAVLPTLGPSWLPWVAVTLIAMSLVLSMVARRAFPPRP
ncbi:MFS transporter [Mycolicibacterium murale]|uniref:MFS transporter n=1 Tax=Mycolicibacterium murale TaxID=182220 RepID=A0A7I9WGX7_9MYCO|nr:MFS transporter [Mycolicibacterium murale]MCV7180788.1 MFS transporter [Mycolicibacterium murale]GFG57011.1 MFS transporter [Mycolicibacterium murale]